MKSFNNWIFIELKMNSMTTTVLPLSPLTHRQFVIICSVDASKWPVGQLPKIHRILMPSICVFAMSEKLFSRWIMSFPFRLLHLRGCLSISVAAENEITVVCVRWIRTLYVYRWPFALISFCSGRRVQLRSSMVIEWRTSVRRKWNLIWFRYYGHLSMMRQQQQDMAYILLDENKWTNQSMSSESNLWLWQSLAVTVIGN